MTHSPAGGRNVATEMNVSAEKPVIGIVGGVGAGKSTVAAALAEFGCAVIDCDAIGHELLDREDVRAELRGRWGDGVFSESGAVDRDALAKTVFGSCEEVRALNAIVHPQIRRRVEDRIAEVRRSQDVVAIVLDAAAVIEAGWDDLWTHLVFVRAPEQARADRAGASRGWNEKDWRDREKSQISLDSKAARCDYIVDNSSSLSHLREQIHQLFLRIMQAVDRP